MDEVRLILWQRLQRTVTKEKGCNHDADFNVYLVCSDIHSM